MSRTTSAPRVALVGARTLLGKEILVVLGERKFDVSSVIEAGGEESDPDLPVIDLAAGELAPEPRDRIDVNECDFLFLAARPHSAAAKRWLDEQLAFQPQARSAGTGCRIIDADRVLPPDWQAVVSIPALDQYGTARPEAGSARCYIAPHAATILISTVLLRLASRFHIERSVAHVFTSASELGAGAIGELQKQTTQLLSFQKPSRAWFGAQSTFNLLPRLQTKTADLSGLTLRVRNELDRYLAARAPLPAIRLAQAPIFHSLAVSMYIETAESVKPAEVEETLAVDGMKLTPASSPPRAPQEIQGSSTIALDPVVADEQRPGGFWVWAAADNLRLAAENAVDIAERLRAT
ncbi:MAG: Asd/ArgC dimerization domain-containing protein [Terriglobia bacterium]